MFENKNKIPQVVIVGAGFGGLQAVHSLAGQNVQVTMVDRHNYHLFQPLLYQVASAGLSAEDIAFPVRSILRKQKNSTFRLAEVLKVDLASKSLRTTNGEIAFDYLVIAVGGVTNFFGMDALATNSFALKDIDEANDIRNHLLRMFELASEESDPETRRALLTFVVVGGGPTGVESAGALSELTRMLLSRDYPNLDAADVRVVLLEAANRLLAAFPPDLSASTQKVLEQKRVIVRLETAVDDFNGSQVTLKGGEILDSYTLIWAAGVRAHPLAQQLGLPIGSQGRVKVLPTLQLPGFPEVYVIGDAAYLEDKGGKPLPMVAPVAIQQARIAARNILHTLMGGEIENFIYKDPGILATIGRNQAVAYIGGFKFRGFLAWVVWLVVHILQLIGFRNRLIVLINWAWDYFLYERAVRLIEPAGKKG